jgi:hypothetical protein
MQKTPMAGPIATCLVRAIQRIKSARVVDLRAFRERMARATGMQKTVATRNVLADFHPVHAVYVAVQNQVAKGDANKTVAVLKYGVDWSEYIFAGYAGHVTEAIFLEGLPDVPASLPHYSPRTR